MKKTKLLLTTFVMLVASICFLTASAFAQSCHGGGAEKKSVESTEKVTADREGKDSTMPSGNAGANTEKNWQTSLSSALTDFEKVYAKIAGLLEKGKLKRASFYFPVLESAEKEIAKINIPDAVPNKEALLSLQKELAFKVVALSDSLKELKKEDAMLALKEIEKVYVSLKSSVMPEHQEEKTAEGS